mmetsp:Transcript_44617/g.142207  ORF Transcript_44617/g.142207 Transcript_44617/m.142207 type:complete len:194 (-) Transcript_44617:220-801(-)
MVEARAIEEPTSAAEQVGAAASVLDEPEQHTLNEAEASVMSALYPITPITDAWSDGVPGPQSEESEGGLRRAHAQQEQGDASSLPRPCSCAACAGLFADPLLAELQCAADLEPLVTEPAPERPKQKSLVVVLRAAASALQADRAPDAACRCFVHRLGWRELGVAPAPSAGGGLVAVDWRVELPTWRSSASGEE